MSPAGLGTKNYCAGEDQQQFSSQPVYSHSEFPLRLYPRYREIPAKAIPLRGPGNPVRYSS
jgi:hypothetical protein